MMAPTAPAPQAMPTPPPAPAAPLVIPTTPPPQSVNQGDEDSAIVKKRKSKRKELQQASTGTSALRIDLNKSIGSAKGSTGSTGLNIPK